MENNHLTYFKIENFKKFDSLEVKNIGQFNLIVGDNNVGKTCLLESLSIDLSAKKMISALHFIYDKRKIFINYNVDYPISETELNFQNNLIGLTQKDKTKSIKIKHKFADLSSDSISVENLSKFDPNNSIETKEFIEKVNLFQYKGLNQLSKNWLIFKKGKKEEIIFLSDVTSSYYKDFYNYLNYMPFIRMDDLYANDLMNFFQKIVRNPKDEEKLLSILNKIFKDVIINRLAIFEYFNGEEFLQVSTNKKPDYHPINEYGDGFIKVLRIIFELLLKENNRICIDEIEAGVHYSKQKDFWMNIMMVCQEFDVQLFATTHSEECAKAYLDASKVLENKNKIRLIKLEVGTNIEKVYASTLTYEQIETGFQSNIDLRS